MQSFRRIQIRGIVLLDPMLATGSGRGTITFLKKQGA